MLIRYYGHVGAPSGYGDAGNEFCMALLETGHELEISTTGTELAARFEPLAGHIKSEGDLRSDPDVIIVHTLPLSCGEFLDKRGLRAAYPSAKIVAYTTWEGADPAPTALATALADFDQVWVPSYATANVMRRGDVAPVHVVPHPFAHLRNGISARACSRCGLHHPVESYRVGSMVMTPRGLAEVLEWSQYNCPVYVRVEYADGHRANHHPCELTAYTPAGTPYRFYYIGAWNIRKNPEGVVRAYCRAFTADDDVELVLQCQGSSPEMCRITQLATGLTNLELPRIRFKGTRVPDTLIREMHEAFDCFVTASRGEAWNLPAFDAMLMGRHIIAPHGHGSDDFLQETSADLYPSRYAPAGGEVRIQDAAPGPPGTFLAQYIGTQGLTVRQNWLEPDLSRLASLMRSAYLARARTLTLHYNPAERFGHAAVAECIRTLLGAPHDHQD